ncbi:MAG: DUF411 domain-containing protein [Gammaproteobacteria bacterium]|nr:DUF411 domain-containing protein [Gammaproteobacteria bacterium]
MKIIEYGLLVFLGSGLIQSVHAGSIWDQPIENAVDNVSAKVYRSATCGCCKKWVQHMKQQHFNVEDIVLEQRALQQFKHQYGIADNLQSCHTAVVGSHVVEGHVPAADIMRMVKEKPAISGLSVPGMVTGSPGMEMGGRKDPFNVVSFDESGKVSEYNSYTDY